MYARDRNVDARAYKVKLKIVLFVNFKSKDRI